CVSSRKTSSVSAVFGNFFSPSSSAFLFSPQWFGVRDPAGYVNPLVCAQALQLSNALSLKKEKVPCGIFPTRFCDDCRIAIEKGNSLLNGSLGGGGPDVFCPPRTPKNLKRTGCTHSATKRRRTRLGERRIFLRCRGSLRGTGTLSTPSEVQTDKEKRSGLQATRSRLWWLLRTARALLESTEGVAGGCESHSKRRVSRRKKLNETCRLRGQNSGMAERNQEGRGSTDLDLSLRGKRFSPRRADVRRG
ncbi:hypothetical protein TGDOM2_398360, partial [Toxoplasma gondii GAB2-2007-GAL-DOM2]